MISYAGVYLPLATPEVASWVAANVPVRDVYHFARRLWPGKNLKGIAFADAVPDRPVRLDTLWWPSGASRWAVYYGLACEDDLDKIRKVTVYQGNAQSAPFIMTEDKPNPDGTRTTVATVQTNLWMLPARPLAQIYGSPLPIQQLYLLTLVDERFYWWRRYTSTQFASTDTWNQVYANLAGDLGVGISVDTISADYGRPDNHSDLNRQYEAVPPVLDAVAYNCGQRIVRNLAGNVTAQNYATAKTKFQANLALGGVQAAGGAFNWDLPAVV